MIGQIGNRGRGLGKTIDWKLVIIYMTLVLIGWANIYSSVQATDSTGLFDFANRSGKQFVWIAAALVLLGLVILIFGKKREKK